MRFVCSVSYFVLINGKVCGNIKLSRGIRQGDPLSPYIFLLCEEGLSSLLTMAKDFGKIKGLAAARNGPRVVSFILC